MLLDLQICRRKDGHLLLLLGSLVPFQFIKRDLLYAYSLYRWAGPKHMR